MAKLTRMRKIELYDKWVTAGKPDVVEFSKTIDIKESLMTRVIREGDAAAIRNQH